MLNKSNCYACAHCRPETQIVPFPLGPLRSTRHGLCGTFFFFQDSTAWGNKSCQALSLLYPKVQHPVGQPLRTIQLPSPNVSFTLCLSQQGENLAFLGSLTGCSELKPFQELTHQSGLSHPPVDVWWYCGGPLLDTAK
uniref:Uncharacterized protein n=1 Tax=Macaca fascicularis TaxID=9541 RepID=A0A7N9IC06_MACFA